MNRITRMTRLCVVSVLLVMLTLIPMSASAITMDDMCWTIRKDGGKTILYLDGFWRHPQNMDYSELHVDQELGIKSVDVIEFGSNYIGRGDIYRTSIIRDLYLPHADEYRVGPEQTPGWFGVLHISGDHETLPELEMPYNYGWRLNGGFDVDGTVKYIPDDAFCWNVSMPPFRCYAYMNIHDNEQYSMANGVLARNDTGMPLWATDENIFIEMPWAYMYSQDHQSVMLWYVYKDKLEISPTVYLPDTTQSGLPVRWISAQAMQSLGTVRQQFEQNVEKQRVKVASAQSQLDRWIASGKKTEKEISKQRDKVAKEQEKLEAMQQQDYGSSVSVWLGCYVEAVADFKDLWQDVDVLYVPVTLIHPGEGLNRWDGVIWYYIPQQW